MVEDTKAQEAGITGSSGNANPYKNKNILVFLVFSGFSSTANGIMWLSVTFLIYALGGSNTSLGTIGGIAMLFTVAASLLGSLVSDRFRRDVVIWVGSMLALGGFYALVTANSLQDILIGQAIAQLGGGIISPPLNALLADSTPSDARNRVYGTAFMISMFSSALGNIIGYGVFTVYGSSLNVFSIRITLWVAFVLFVIAIGTSFFLRDKHKLSEDQEKSLLSQDTTQKLKGGFTSFSLFVLIVVVLSNDLVRFGAGISIPYFPKFFLDLYDLNLADMSLIFAGMTIITGIWAKYITKLADKYGRVFMIVVSQMTAVVLLYVLVFYPPLIIALLTILVRNAAMNASGPLTQALVMDYTPRKWRSMVTMVMSLSWSFLFGVGQYLGGRIVDAYTYRLAFVITATLYLIGTIGMFFIKEKKKGDEAVENGEDPVKRVIRE